MNCLDYQSNLFPKEYEKPAYSTLNYLDVNNSLDKMYPYFDESNILYYSL